MGAGIFVVRRLVSTAKASKVAKHHFRKRAMKCFPVGVATLIQRAPHCVEPVLQAAPFVAGGAAFISPAIAGAASVICAACCACEREERRAATPSWSRVHAT